MQPLRITAELAECSLIAVDTSLPIDGPLAWAWMREKYPENMYFSNLGTTSYIETDLSEILAIVEMKGQWFYACSWAVFNPVKENMKYRHRRFDSYYAETYADLGKRKSGKVIVAGGTFKTRRIPYIIISTDKIVWFCVGDIQRIEKLLNSIEYIGSSRATGYGRVGKWLVQPCAEDWSVYGPDGCLMRAIPSDSGDKLCALRPPYWAGQKVLCATPL